MFFIITFLHFKCLKHDLQKSAIIVYNHMPNIQYTQNNYMTKTTGIAKNVMQMSRDYQWEHRQRSDWVKRRNAFKNPTEQTWWPPEIESWKCEWLREPLTFLLMIAQPLNIRCEYSRKCVICGCVWECEQMCRKIRPVNVSKCECSHAWERKCNG